MEVRRRGVKGYSEDWKDSTMGNRVDVFWDDFLTWIRLILVFIVKVLIFKDFLMVDRGQDL